MITKIFEYLFCSPETDFPQEYRMRGLSILMVEHIQAELIRKDYERIVRSNKKGTEDLLKELRKSR